MKNKLLAVIFCIITGFLMYACNGVSNGEESGETFAPAETETGSEIKEESKVSFFDNYMEAPAAMYNVYETPVEIKGIYVSALRAGGVKSDGTRYIDDLVSLINETELNAMVVDIKDENGNITFKNKITRFDEMGLSKNYIPDIDGLMEKLYANDIYPIARIVAFKDNAMPDTRPELMVQNADGSIYRDNGNNAWLNPYLKENWEIAVEVAKCAAMLGFKEIQFDYVRFVADARLNEDNFGDTNGKTKEEIILEFIQYAVDELHPLGVKVSADVYGTVIISSVDAGIVGQNYVEMSKILDVICPMVYPSHYGQGYFGVAYPDLEPYKIIYESISSSNKKLAEIPEGEHRAVVRPWLQAFTATYLKNNYQKYEGPQIREQIKAVFDSGEAEWLVWNPSVNYPSDGFETVSGIKDVSSW